jgi:prepilin-type N-terminal cleavage/methylation domain-containing protein
LKKGFTLIETMVALSLTAIFLAGAYYALGIELNFWQRLADRINSQQAYEAVAQRLLGEIRGAAEVLPGSSQTELKIQLGADQLTYSLAGGKVRRQKNASAAYLTDDGEVSSFLFSYPTAKLVEVIIDGRTLTAALRN